MLGRCSFAYYFKSNRAREIQKNRKSQEKTKPFYLVSHSTFTMYLFGSSNSNSSKTWLNVQFFTEIYCTYIYLVSVVSNYNLLSVNHFTFTFNVLTSLNLVLILLPIKNKMLFKASRTIRTWKPWRCFIALII